jgi:hypothetical protein
VGEILVGKSYVVLVDTDGRMDVCANVWGCWGSCANIQGGGDCEWQKALERVELQELEEIIVVGARREETRNILEVGRASSRISGVGR